MLIETVLSMLTVVSHATGILLLDLPRVPERPCYEHGLQR